MNVNEFFAVAVLGAIGLYFGYAPIVLLSAAGLLWGVVSARRESAKVKMLPMSPAVRPRSRVLQLPMEELESKHVPLPDELQDGPVSFSNIMAQATGGQAPVGSPPTHKHYGMDFPGYGPAAILEKMFAGLPRIVSRAMSSGLEWKKYVNPFRPDD